MSGDCMSAEDRGILLFSLGVAIVAFGTVIYGLVTGHIMTLGGQGRNPDMIWQSRMSEPQLFWFAVGVHSAVGVFFSYLAVTEAMGRE